MRVVLLKPLIQDFYETNVRLQPIGLYYLKAVEKQHRPDTQVIIKDYHQGWGRRTIPAPKELAYLRYWCLTPAFWHQRFIGNCRCTPINQRAVRDNRCS